jgi:hypothetical protein
MSLFPRRPRLAAAVADREPGMILPGAAPASAASSAAGRAWFRLDPFDWLVLLALAAVSMWVVALNLGLAASHGLVWTGIDGEFPVDQMQYLAWVQDASRHVLASDLFLLRSSPHDYLQPMLAISGGLTAAGMAAWLSLLIWKPIAVVAIFFAVRAYCRHTLANPWARRAALVLGLFAASYQTLGDEWLPFLSWGYEFGLVAVAAMIGALVAYGRALTDDRRIWLPGVLGLLAAWLHPWQGELLILVVIGSELVVRLRSRRLGEWRSLPLPAVTIVATVLPLLYYAVLERSDPFWQLAETVTRHHPWSLSGALLPLAPLLVGAAVAYRRAPASFTALTARVWVLAAFVVWFVTKAGVGATPLHAWTGITVPLGVLAVEGVQGLGFSRLPAHRWIGALAVAALTIPGIYLQMEPTKAYIGPETGNPNLVTHSEQRALQYLADDPRPGGVLSAYRLGDAVPGLTGRHSVSGDYRWSGAAYESRELLAYKLLHGSLTGSAARSFVLGTGARFVLSDCGAHADLTRSLAPLKLSAHRFGCAAVYEIG